MLYKFTTYIESSERACALLTTRVQERADIPYNQRYAGIRRGIFLYSSDVESVIKELDSQSEQQKLENVNTIAQGIKAKDKDTNSGRRKIDHYVTKRKRRKIVDYAYKASRSDNEDGGFNQERNRASEE